MNTQRRFMFFVTLFLCVRVVFAAPAEGYAYPDPYPGDAPITAEWIELKIAANWLQNKGTGQVVNLVTFAILAKQKTR